MTVSDAPSGSPQRTSARRSGLFGLVVELLKFGAVGAIAFVVDFSVYNLLRFTILDDKPIGAKIISVAVATVVSWLGSRYWTFKDGRNASAGKEFLQFAVINVGGLLVATLCLYVSHYMLGFTSKLADNISGNGVGLILGTAFRYAMYKLMLFRPATTGPADTGTAGTGTAGTDSPALDVPALDTQALNAQALQSTAGTGDAAGTRLAVEPSPVANTLESDMGAAVDDLHIEQDVADLDTGLGLTTRDAKSRSENDIDA